MDKNRISFAMHVLHFTATPKRHGLIKAKHGDRQHVIGTHSGEHVALHRRGGVQTAYFACFRSPLS